MPPVLIPVAITAAIGTAAVAIGVTTIASAVLTVATTAALAGLSYLAANAEKGAGSAVGYSAPKLAAPANYRRNMVTQQATPERRYVYGTARTAGAILFRETSNPKLYTLLGLSDGVISGVNRLFLGDKQINFDSSGDATVDSAYFEKMAIEARTGEDDQLASDLIVDAFPGVLTSDFRQRGVATLTVRCDWGTDNTNNNFLWSGGVNPIVEVEGVKVYDPRDPTHDLADASTWTFSDNPALCFAHALSNCWDLALPDPANDIDWDTVGDAANVCDAPLNGQKLFTMAGVFQSGHDLASQLTAMLRCFGGTIAFDDGKFKIFADAERVSTLTLVDTDLLEIGDYQHEGEASYTPTAVKAMFFDENGEGVRVSTPIYTHSSAATEGYREATIDLPFTPSEQAARILSYRELIRARVGRELSIHTTDKALFLIPNELITIASSDLPMINGSYEVIDVDPAAIGVNLKLRAYDADAYLTAFLTE